jgi:uncharacterized surface protein with fasciclin (FAS1) repeats
MTRGRISYVSIPGTLVVLLIGAMFSCGKTKPRAVVPITPLQTLVNSDTTLTLFHRMLIQANETGLLADQSITLLIPTNAALRQSGFSDTTIDSSGAYIIDRILRFQYITPAATPDSAGYKAYPTLLGFTIHGMRDAAGHTYFNGIGTTGDAIAVGKALVFRINGVIPAARDSLVDLFGLDSSLSFAAELFRRTNLYDSVLLSGNYTLLAPVNNAFRQAGYDSVGAIDSADINTLIQLAENQVLKGIYFTNTFPNTGVITSLGGGAVTVSSSGGHYLFAGAGNTTPANWLSGNQQSGSSLAVHRIDQVISP